MVKALPVRLTEPCQLPPVDGARPAKPSGTGVLPVVGAGLRVALPDLVNPPATRIDPAVTWELPLAARAVADFESTTKAPGMLMLALFEKLAAPLELGSR